MVWRRGGSANAAEMFFNLKDAVAYFGPAALLPWNPLAKARG